MRKLTGLLAVIVVALGLMVAAPLPAQAGVPCDTGVSCGSLRHLSDDGFDAPIPITCDWGNDNPHINAYVAEGQKSSCHDTDGFYVQPGADVVCRFFPAGRLYWKTFENGWYKITDLDHYECVHQLD